MCNCKKETKHHKTEKEIKNKTYNKDEKLKCYTKVYINNESNKKTS